MAGTKNDVIVAKNADFSQAAAPNPQSSENNGLITNGQLWVGTTVLNAGGTHINVLTLTAGTGISIVQAATTLTIATTPSFNWTDVTTATQAIVVQNGYLTDRGAGVTYTLPATAVFGDSFIIVGKLGLATITPNANQQLLMGSASGTIGAAGTAVATNVGDSVTFRCITSGASTVWRAESWVGNWTLS